LRLSISFTRQFFSAAAACRKLSRRSPASVNSGRLQHPSSL
jgi:hypothetical protein